MSITIFERLRNLILFGQYIPVGYFVYDARRLVYISIPKVACTSIKIALMPDSAPGNDEYTSYMRVHHEADTLHYPRLPRHAREYFKFAFVRNPFDRLVSFYEDKVRRPVQHDGRYYFDSSYNKRLIKSLYGNSFSKEMDFKEFAQLVARVPDWIADAHFKSQTAMLFHRNRKIPDYIGHFETMERDWTMLIENYGLPSLGRRNATTASDWRSYYTDRSIVELIGNRYRADITNFGYQDQYEDILMNCDT